MRPYLLYKDRDFIPNWGMLLKSSYATWWRERDYDELWKDLPLPKQFLLQDLELDILFRTMAQDDPFIFEVVKNVILEDNIECNTILYRQEILKDCLKNRDIIRSLYQIAVDALEEHAKYTRYASQSIESIHRTALHILDNFLTVIKKIRDLDKWGDADFSSEGFKNFFCMINTKYSDDFIESLKELISELYFPYGLVTSAQLGKGNKGVRYLLHRYQRPKKKGIVDWLLFKDNRAQFTITIAERDYNGFKALSEIRAKGMSSVTHVLGQSSDYAHTFLLALKRELAFYIGCLNVAERLESQKSPICFPTPHPLASRVLSFHGLYDVSLALQMNQKVVGNSVNGTSKDVFIITGANRGGKSTFLRSIGLTQLMMQSGMFVSAETFASDICTGVFTHFKREEDPNMRSGKLDEELNRISIIVDFLKKDSVVLFNESFSATNEREGSEISMQIVSALLKKEIRVFFVTHLYEFSRTMYEKKMDNVLFLRAERQPDGHRTYRMIEGNPLITSYAEDLYARIFNTASTR